MLTQQQFKEKEYKITLTLDSETSMAKIGVFSIGELVNDDNAGQVIELPVNIMRKLVRILKDSPFIFSEQNK